MRDLHQIMKDIQPYIDFVFEHEDEFMGSFIDFSINNVPCITEISFGANEIKFAYDLEIGKSTQAITTDEFISWMRKVRGEYP